MIQGLLQVILMSLECQLPWKCTCKLDHGKFFAICVQKKKDKTTENEYNTK